jgi:hypothetical protein
MAHPVTHHTLYFSDVRVEIDSDCAEVDALIVRDWQAARRPILETTRTQRIGVRASSELVMTFDGEIVWREPLDATPADAFELVFYRRMLADHCDRFGVFHGAAVQARGTAFVFCGPSGSGKSSLSVAATRRGYHYYSDEFVVTDGFGLWGWPRTPQFGPDPDSSSLPSWLTSIGPPDAHGTYRSPVGLEQVASEPTGHSHVHFVSIARGPETGLVPINRTTALRHWLEARFFQPPMSLGQLVGTTRTWQAQWRHPDELLDALELLTVAEQRPPSASVS